MVVEATGGAINAWGTPPPPPEYLTIKAPIVAVEAEAKGLILEDEELPSSAFQLITSTDEHGTNDLPDKKTINAPIIISLTPLPLSVVFNFIKFCAKIS